MALSEYTSFNDVRAALGVSDKEIEDETLELGVYSDGLEEDLYDVSATLAAVFKGIDQTPVNDRSPEEERVHRLTRLFATYSVARQLCTSLPMFGPKTITDGKASMTRFSGEPYKDVAKKVLDQYDLFRRRLAQALEDLSPPATPATVRVLFAAVGSGYDPVTGE